MLRHLTTLAAVLLAAHTLWGQAGATGTILGTVSDSSGAVVPNVKVTVTNMATNAAFQTATSSAGDFLAPSLNPGVYSVTAEYKGFQKSVTNNVILAVDQKTRVDLTLRPGAATDTVEVTAQALTLDTDTASMSNLISRQQVEELPLNGRNFMQLLLVSAGAVTVGGEQGTMRQGEGNAVSINGGRPEGNNYTLDGLVNTDQALVTPAVMLSQDAIQEFKVESGTYSAEYGFSASQINIVSKGGTNKLHGTLFEDNRNNAYDAKPFPTAADSVPTTLPILRQNQFGYVADGPVFIPKLYDGRDKTFWMANYEGWRINNGTTLKNYMPNPNVLTGDFSAETNANTGALLPAYGTPACATLLALNQNCMPVDPTTGQPFSGNKIPTARITNRLALVAQKYNYFLAPTLANASEGTINYFKNFGLALTTNQQTYRVDQNLGRLGSIFFRYTYAKYQNGSLNTGTLTYGLETQYETQKNWAISHTINLGQKNVNNFRFGYLDAQAPQGAPAPPSDAVSALAMTGVFSKFGPLQQTWPNINLSQYTSTGGPVNSYTGSDNPSWEFADSFTSVHGKHTLGAGVDYRTWKLVRNLDDDFYGDWQFRAGTILSNGTNCPNATGLCGTGNAVADMLLGYYSNVSGFVPGPLSPTDQAGNPQTHVFAYFAPYVEDDWKMTQKLTLNLGLRWDFRAAAYEQSNHFFWLDTRNANGGLCYADPKLTSNGVAPGGTASDPVLRYCGSVPHPGSKTPFAPRFGAAYRLNNKTVIRGGYGIFFDSAEGREIDDSADIYPYSIRLSESPTSDSTLPKLGNSMYPSFGTLGPFPLSTLSFVAVIESENPLNPYVQSWIGSVEREVAKNTTLEVNYVGTHAVHLLDRRNIAQPNAIPASSLAFCDATNASGTLINSGVAPCSNTSRLPYENFTNYYIDSDWHGYSHYNAMNVKFEHRAGDLAVAAIYTWANSKDDKSAAAGVGATGAGYQGFEDNHHPELDYGPSDFDVDNRFVTSYIWQLPVGRGKKVAGNINRAADAAIGGWQISGITTFQTGFPFSITANDVGGYLNTPFQRANTVSGCDPHGSLTQKFQRLNMSCFAQPGAGVFGNSARNFLRQPGINNWDMTFGKNFDITEQVKFGLRIGTFNTFNHHQYSYTVGGLATGGNGGTSAITNSVGSSLAGLITSSGTSRVLQLGGKLTF